MGFPETIFQKLGMLRLAIFCVLMSAASARSEDVSLESAGLRYGFSARAHTASFKGSDVFVDWNLPWSYDMFSRWHLQWRLDCSAGWIGGNGDRAAVFASGPSFLMRRDHIPLSMEFGFTPALLSRYTFGSKDFGTPAQFISYVGLDVDLWRHTRIAYRYQHMSNAHLDGHNPGLNMHVFQVSWRF